MDGPLVVFAGAGSGKTRIITTRIARLISQGVHPWEILAVTFTNKAAKEMKERAEHICPEARRSVITTFHSASARWLREFADELGFQNNFSIYDDGDSTRLLKKILKEFDPKGNIPNLLSEMQSFIRFAKINGLTPHDAEKNQSEFVSLIPTGGLALYHKYQEQLYNNNAMDFGDLLLNLLLLLKRNRKVSDILSSRFKYILVDEFQDTNRTQFEIVKLLSAKHGNLFVVGDDDQSIYSWRGASPGNIIDFQTLFPGSLQVALEQNYRCSGNIVSAASAVIQNNKHRAPKTLFTEADSGDPIDLHIESDGDMEAWWVVQSILQERSLFKYEDIAIFYRTNSQSRSIEEALRRQNVPYTIFGSVEFYDRLEIKDIMAYIRVVVNPSDQLSLTRIINVPPRGLGAKAVELVETQAKDRQISLLDAIDQLGDEGIPRVGTKLRYFADLMKALKNDLINMNIADVVKTILEATSYTDYLQKKFPDQYRDKLDNIQELAAGMVEFQKQNPDQNLEDWLQSVTLVRGNDQQDQGIGVSLMTLHMAKGLEFNRVYLTGVEDGLIPHKNSLDDSSQTEEERRLLYVGITRAKKKLSLLGASKRRTYNSYTINPPSRFIEEIPVETMNVSQAAQAILDAHKSAESEPSSDDDLLYGELSYEPDSSELSIGDQVRHPTYGKGAITGFEHKFGQAKVIINFHDFGYRKIRPTQLVKL